MFAKSLQWRDGDDLAVDVDDEHAGGGWSPPEVIPATFPPSNILRRQPAVSLFLFLSCGVSPFEKCRGGSLYRRF